LKLELVLLEEKALHFDPGNQRVLEHMQKAYPTPSSSSLLTRGGHFWSGLGGEIHLTSRPSCFSAVGRNRWLWQSWMLRRNWRLRKNRGIQCPVN